MTSTSTGSPNMSRPQALKLGIVATLMVSFLVACGGNAPTAEPTIAAAPTAEPTMTAVPTAEPTITAVPTASGPRAGDVAPDFTLPDKDGNMVRLADELKDHSSVVLVFYFEGT
jgi:hypothetical protein